MKVVRFVPVAVVAVLVGILAIGPGMSGSEARIEAGGPAFSTLAEAARQPVGKGRDTTSPAAGIRGGSVRVDPEAVLPEDGHTVHGCVPGYGDAGQCVPHHGPGGGTMNCGYLKRMLPEGIAVTGRDTLGLDSNADGIACGPGDRGVGARR